MIKNLFILLIVLFSFNVDIKAQTVDTCFTQTEVLGIFNGIQELQIKDSLKTALVAELKYQIEQYKILHNQDTLIQGYQAQEIALLKQRIELYKDLVKQTKPKWYQTKAAGFIQGALTIIVASWVVANTR
jgi:hypothetical protein